MSDNPDPYPQTCPFCTIASAYPFPAAAAAAAASTAPKYAPPRSPSNENDVDVPLTVVPDAPDVTKVDPSCFLVLSAPQVMAFLDILPMTRGHLLVIVRGHRGKVADLEAGEARDVGFWLPVLAKVVAKVTGTSDYNIVQNNGVRAAQVVPHVHFHIIPRPESVPELKNKSWTMFGRGQREEIDDEEGEKLASELREELRKELQARNSKKSLL